MRHSGDPTGPIGYVVVEPPQAAPGTPLVIALHGRGDHAESFAGLAEALGLPVRTVVARAPMPFGMSGGRRWYDSGGADAKATVRQRVDELKRLVEKLRRRYPEAGKPILYGFSQGAVVALQAAAERPGLFAGVAALSGYLATEEGAVSVDAPLPILVVWGKRDRVIAPKESKRAATFLESLGHRPIRFEFDGPHRISRPVLDRLRVFIRELR